MHLGAPQRNNVSLRVESNVKSGCPERLCSLCPWRFLRQNWKKPWEAMSDLVSDPALGWRLEKRGPQVHPTNYPINLWVGIFPQASCTWAYGMCDLKVYSPSLKALIQHCSSATSQWMIILKNPSGPKNPNPPQMFLGRLCALDSTDMNPSPVSPGTRGCSWMPREGVSQALLVAHTWLGPSYF